MQSKQPAELNDEPRHFAEVEGLNEACEWQFVLDEPQPVRSVGKHLLAFTLRPGRGLGATTDGRITTSSAQAA